MFGSGLRGWRRREWMRILGLGFTNPQGTGGVLACVCVCSDVGGEWVGGLDQGLECWVVLCLDYLC